MAKNTAKEYSASSTDTFILALQNPDLYPHPVKYFRLIETHISWVLLTGHYAYKIKKPVDFGFVDFSSLCKRKFYCEEELRLNRRFSPELYLEVVHFYGSYENPQIGNTGETIEYAVKMKEFSQSSLLSEIATEHLLQPDHIDSIGDVISEFHNSIIRSDTNTQPTSADTILKWSRENFDRIEAVIDEAVLPGYFNELKTWCLDTGTSLVPTMTKRLENNFVRECHGDLHLGNIALIDGRITLFDCIEFNPELRWIDMISEVAFVAMDLQARDYIEFAWRFINHYLEATGDYEGLVLLRYYIVYRALVRAKVEALQLTEQDSEFDGNDAQYQPAFHYLQLAYSWINRRQPAIIIMHGLSGSGKSTLAGQLVEQLGAIRIRSDVERKRLFALESGQASQSPVERGIYTKDATQLTYNQLAELTKIILKTGFIVIVDASFLKQRFRHQFRQLARENQSSCVLVSCDLPETILRERILKRHATGKDPSEANLAVLSQQLQTQDRLDRSETENPSTVLINEKIPVQKQIEKIKKQIDCEELIADIPW